MKRILFRADGGFEIGLGHVKRTLNVISDLSLPSEFDVWLVGAFDREIRDSVIEQADLHNIRFIGLSRDSNLGEIEAVFRQVRPALVVNDLRTTNRGYMRLCRTYAKYVVNIEDTGPGRGFSDVLFDANLDAGENLELGNDAGSEINPRIFLGPDYAILAKEILEIRKLVSLNEKVKKIFVSFGGSDPAGLTVTTMDILNQTEYCGETILILGPLFRSSKTLKDVLDNTRMKVKIYSSPDRILDKMASSDLAFTHGGITLCELVSLGIPVLTMEMNSHQAKMIVRFERNGCCCHLGSPNRGVKENLVARVREVIDNFSFRVRLSENGKNYIDGKGIFRLERILRSLLKDN